MTDRRFPPEQIARLRFPDRLARMRVDHMTELALEGIQTASMLDCRHRQPQMSGASMPSRPSIK